MMHRCGSVVLLAGYGILQQWTSSGTSDGAMSNQQWSNQQWSNNGPAMHQQKQCPSMPFDALRCPPMPTNAQQCPPMPSDAQRWEPPELAVHSTFHRPKAISASPLSSRHRFLASSLVDLGYFFPLLLFFLLFFSSSVLFSFFTLLPILFVPLHHHTPTPPSTAVGAWSQSRQPTTLQHPYSQPTPQADCCLSRA